ncbi:MAG TPA: hypothetical protein VEQ17_05885 [Steroidobacteraceae bacterium]|nr:hypothetical protein [Steroidobacteraceae bacterium]
MSKKKAPPLPAEQQHFEERMRAIQEPGVTINLSRGEDGRYVSTYARQMWRVWNEAQAFLSPTAGATK